MKLKQADLYRSSLLLFSLLLLAFFSGSCSLIAQDLQREQVSATQYCDFLNHEAVSDSGFFYDEAMSTDPETASILRTGTPGSYHYEVIAGRENFPITYVNAYAQSAFCNEQGFSDDDENSNEDAFLKSNRIGFYAAVSAAPNQESLVPVADAVAAVTSYTPYIAATFATFFGVIFSRCSRSDAEGTPSERVNPNSSDGLGHSLLETHTESSSTYHPPVPLDVPNMDSILTLGRSSTHSSREDLSEAAEKTKSVASGNMEKEASLDSELDHRDLNFEEFSKRDSLDGSQQQTISTMVKAPLHSIAEEPQTPPPSRKTSFVSSPLHTIQAFVPGYKQDEIGNLDAHGEPRGEPSVVNLEELKGNSGSDAMLNERESIIEGSENSESIIETEKKKKRLSATESVRSGSTNRSKISTKIQNDPFSGIGKKIKKKTTNSKKPNKDKEKQEGQI